MRPASNASLSVYAPSRWWAGIRNSLRRSYCPVLSNSKPASKRCRVRFHLGAQSVLGVSGRRQTGCDPIRRKPLAPCDSLSGTKSAGRSTRLSYVRPTARRVDSNHRPPTVECATRLRYREPFGSLAGFEPATLSFSPAGRRYPECLALATCCCFRKQPPDEPAETVLSAGRELRPQYPRN